MSQDAIDPPRGNILVVDDSPANLRLLAGMLAGRGYTVRPVTQGKLALSGARGSMPPDLILLDILMPEPDGYEVCRQLKADPRTRDIPVIFISALDQAFDKVKAFAAGGVDYIGKPFQEEEVLARVESHLALRRAQKELQERNAQLARQIAERVQAEEVLRLLHRFLEIANRQTELPALLGECVVEVRAFTGCAAVGIRLLDDEGNIPYHAYEGFGRHFYESESPLSVGVDPCMCISVVKGEADLGLPYYTEGGSFYTNGTTRFLATVSEEEKDKMRNVCNQAGYESVALVPIRLGEQILGLIHVADPRENAVPLERVQALEGASKELGTAIQRVRAEAGLQRARDELEQRVEARTAELAGANASLKAEIAERGRAQEALIQEKTISDDILTSLPGIMQPLDGPADHPRVVG